MTELFVGPRPYEEQDARFFYARDREARDLVSLVVANPLLLIYAPSGAGKTSLINARLIPMLGTVKDPELTESLGPGKGFTVLPLARVSGLVPEGIDLDATPGANIFVFNTLMSWRKKDATTQSADERRDAERQLAERRLPDFLSQNAPASAVTAESDEDDGVTGLRVVIFDQFEELFTSHLDRWDDREGFFEQVSDALGGGPVLLRRRDLKQPEALIRRLADPDDPVSQELRSRLSVDAKQIFGNLAGATRLSAEDLRVAVEQLNAIIKGPQLYDPQRFAGVEISEVTKKLMINLKKRSHSFSALNRSLLEDAYPQEIYRRAVGDQSLRIVFSMREDYIAELEPYTHLLPNRLGTRFRLERLRRDAALAAITRPMESSHLRFAKDVAEQLVDNLLKTPIRVAAGEKE